MDTIGSWKTDPQDDEADQVLIIAVRSDDSPLPEFMQDEILQACLKKGYEYVPYSLQSPMLEDKEGGISRIFEALEAHSWPRMMLKSSVRSLEEREYLPESLEDQGIFERIAFEKGLSKSEIDILLSELAHDDDVLWGTQIKEGAEADLNPDAFLAVLGGHERNPFPASKSDDPVDQLSRAVEALRTLQTQVDGQNVDDSVREQAARIAMAFLEDDDLPAATPEGASLRDGTFSEDGWESFEIAQEEGEYEQLADGDEAGNG